MAALTSLRGLLTIFIQDVRRGWARMPIIVHFYERIVPQTTGKYGYGPWLGNQMDAVGVPRQPQHLRNDIAAILINQANDMCKSVARRGGGHVRGSTRDRRHSVVGRDHPDDDAFRDIAKKLLQNIPATRGRERGRPRARDGRR